MSRQDIVNFETEVDKHCGAWVQAIAAELAHVKTVIETQTKALTKKITSIPVAQTMDEDELKQIPDRVNEILKQNSVRVSDIVKLTLDMKVDLKKKKVKDGGYNYSTPAGLLR
jgi:hypothetical protein